MRTENGGGDQLAKGAVRARFQTASTKVTQERWDAIWAEETTDAAEDGSRDADVQTAGNAGLEPRKDFPDDSGC